MHIKLFAPLAGIQLSSNEDFIFDSGVISKSQRLLQNEIITPHLTRVLDQSVIRALFRNPFFFSRIDVKDSDPRQKGVQLAQSLDSIIFTSWLLHDNSINVPHAVFWNVSAPHEIHQFNSQVFYSNAEGEVQDVQISNQTLRQICDLHLLFNKHFSGPDFNPIFNIDKHIASDDGVQVTGNQEYNKYSTIARAFLFVREARRNTNIISKISNLTMALETLFTTDRDNIAHDVSVRGACYVSSDLGEREVHYKAIKTGYRIRSNYLHGSRVQSPYDQQSSLLSFAQRLDILTRRIMFKVIKVDSQRFVDSLEARRAWFSVLTSDQK
ncbi:HEPN domain-containing protein [Dyadobacter fermentans]|uniref:Uncharacterized protein n=1 Tax=Dyadobacter fermentans (strain ATCC 700827 / DSM 18053 / CIP 107007 / KCTC 52180 / NS114) TaxID=471854 RepID=C6VVD4_DYAFD|nr:HEPN domain-containing protein [Dyadobacter fermentans]ACT96664.1 hypothetical protein Dfer_5473 [Dyadobacter fermentans DSM 18053]